MGAVPADVQIERHETPTRQLDSGDDEHTQSPPQTITTRPGLPGTTTVHPESPLII